MAEKGEIKKIILEREYLVPLRRKWMKTPEYKRASKAVKSLKEFIAKHMKIAERDLKKVKLDKWLNEELWFRGIRKPLAKVRVKALKYDSGIVEVKLADIPPAFKWKIEKEKKQKEISEKTKEKKEAEKKEEEEKERKPEEKKDEKPEGKTEEQKKETEEKEKSTAEAGAKEAEKKHIEVKHETAKKQQKTTPRRMALKK